MESHEGTLCKLSIADDAYFEALLACDSVNLEASGLDAKTHALVRLGGLVAIDGAAPCYLGAIGVARAHGASDEEIVGCLIAMIPTLGIARVVSAAPQLGLALGFDVAVALEAAQVSN